MKKLMVVLITILFLIGSPAVAIDWTVANEKSVVWDAVTTLSDDSIIPAGDKVEYELFLVSYKSTDRDADKTSMGITELLEFTYSFVAEGRYLAGIRAIRTPENLPDEKSYSEIVWSDSATDVPIPFGFIYLLKPGKVGTFKPK